MGQEAKGPEEVRLLGPDYFPKGVAAVRTVWFIILGNILEWCVSLIVVVVATEGSVSTMEIFATSLRTFYLLVEGW